MPNHSKDETKFIIALCIIAIAAFAIFAGLMVWAAHTKQQAFDNCELPSVPEHCADKIWEEVRKDA